VLVSIVGPVCRLARPLELYNRYWPFALAAEGDAERKPCSRTMQSVRNNAEAIDFSLFRNNLPLSDLLPAIWEVRLKHLAQGVTFFPANGEVYFAVQEAVSPFG